MFMRHDPLKGHKQTHLEVIWSKVNTSDVWGHPHIKLISFIFNFQITYYMRHVCIIMNFDEIITYIYTFM